MSVRPLTCMLTGLPIYRGESVGAIVLKRSGKWPQKDRILGEWVPESPFIRGVYNGVNALKDIEGDCPALIRWTNCFIARIGIRQVLFLDGSTDYTPTNIRSLLACIEHGNLFEAIDERTEQPHPPGAHPRYGLALFSANTYQSLKDAFESLVPMEERVQPADIDEFFRPMMIEKVNGEDAIHDDVMEVVTLVGLMHYLRLRMQPSDIIGPATLDRSLDSLSTRLMNEYANQISRNDDRRFDLRESVALDRAGGVAEVPIPIPVTPADEDNGPNEFPAGGATPVERTERAIDRLARQFRNIEMAPQEAPRLTADEVFRRDVTGRARWRGTRNTADEAVRRAVEEVDAQGTPALGVQNAAQAAVQFIRGPRVHFTPHALAPLIAETNTPDPHEVIAEERRGLERLEDGIRALGGLQADEQVTEQRDERDEEPPPAQNELPDPPRTATLNDLPRDPTAEAQETTW